MANYKCTVALGNTRQSLCDICIKADVCSIAKEFELSYKMQIAQCDYFKGCAQIVELPCKIGDTVYVKMQFGGYAEAEVRDYSYFISCGFCVVVTSEKFDKQNVPFSEFGKTIFLTPEEAEQFT